MVLQAAWVGIRSLSIFYRMLPVASQVCFPHFPTERGYLYSQQRNRDRKSMTSVVCNHVHLDRTDNGVLVPQRHCSTSGARIDYFRGPQHSPFISQIHSLRPSARIDPLSVACYPQLGFEWPVRDVHNIEDKQAEGTRIRSVQAMHGAEGLQSKSLSSGTNRLFSRR
jgi:hypothetical protein